jgi:energy-converting hydrogenase Eha subunit F
MRKSKEDKTYFEQVPLEIVKKIAEEEIPDTETDGAGVPVEPPAKHRGAFPRFRSARVKVL